MKFLSIIKSTLALISIAVVLSVFFLEEGQAVDLIIFWGYIVLAIAACTLIVFPIINTIKDPKGSGGTLIGALLFVGILVCGYLFGSSEPMLMPNGVDYFDNVFELKLTDMFIYTFYLTIVGVIAAIIYGTIRNSLK